MDEIRLACRRLTKHPAATLASIATLACAIGAAAAAWSLLSAVLLRPLPVRDSDRLFVVGTPVTSGRAAGTIDTSFVYPYFPHVRDSGILERVAAVWHPAMRLLADPGTGRSYAYVSFVTHDYFDVLGVRLQSGRPFTAADDREGAPPVAIVSDSYWRRAFGGAEGVTSRTVIINNRAVSVIGIAAAGFRGVDLAQSPDFYLPFHVIADVAGPPTNYFARPNVGMSPTAGVMLIGRSAEPRTRIDARLAAVPPLHAGSTTRLVASPIDVEAVPAATRAGVTQFARILVATVALLLLAGCLTVGTLLLVRTEARREEFATCLALGATRARLARGIAIEGAMLSVVGASIAIPVSIGLFSAIRAYELPGGVSIDTLGLSLDLRVLAAAAGGALTAMALITIATTLLGFRADIADAIRSRSTTPQLARRRSRAVLVAGQVAVALALVAGAGVFTRTLMAALALNTGLEPASLVTGSLSLRPYDYDASRATEFFDRLGTRLEGNPSIASFSFFEQTGGMSGKLAIDGVPRQFPTQVDFTAIDVGYFSTLGLRVTSGRAFARTDGPAAPLVGIVSASYGRLLAEGAPPIGKRITMPFHRLGEPPPQVEIVGVVPDVITRVSVIEPLVLYLPLGQQTPATYRQWIVRAASDTAVTMNEITTAIREIDNTIVPPRLSTLQDVMAQQMNAQHFGAVVLGGLGGIAVLLTLLGTYVLAESMAVRRAREMGVRAALGATRPQLAGLVLAETGRLVGLGIVTGLFLAWLGASTIRSFMFRVQPLDPATLATASIAILVLALAVTARPALRTARVDLASVLRSE